MSINTISSQTVQPIAWKKDNKQIPEDHLNDIVECAINMPSAGLTASPEAGNKKSYQIWIPQRESELENALACASLWSCDQCQDQTFNNASTVLVYILKEPEHLANIAVPDLDPNDITSYAFWDQQMDIRIAKDWNGTQKLLQKLLDEEATKKNSMKYNDRPVELNPFTGWYSEHVSALNLTLGMAMAASALRARELGYFCQHYTAYRQTVTWHDQYKNKFHKDGKWFPYMIQIIGTSPEAVKIAPSRIRKQQVHQKSIIDPHADLNEKNMKSIDDKDFYVMSTGDGNNYRKTFLSKSPREIPDYQIKFFMDNYGRYSDNPRKLFRHAYAFRVKEWEKYLNDWFGQNPNA